MSDIKLDIVLQGWCEPITKEIIDTYNQLDFVDKIILSSYTDSITFDIPNHVQFVNNDTVAPAGIGNRNLQINTSRNGLNLVQNKYVAKMRADQLIRPDSMQVMYDYWIANDDPANRQAQPGKPLGRIYVSGLYRDFPYHPRDHVFWGFTADVKKLMDCPFDTNPLQNADYNAHTRAETYIGQYYYALYDSDIQAHIDNPKQYLTDSAPFKHEAMEKDWAIRDELFKVFPRVSIHWPKHKLWEYHYHVGEQFSEYWAD
jgi:hypothetical protein